MPARLLALLALLALASCTGLGQTHTYAGPQTPLAGICDPPSQATLTQRGQEFLLAPGNGTISLEGPATGPSFTLQTTLTGADKKPFPIAFAGQIATDAVTGTLTTPRCRYALRLKRTSD